MSFLSYVLFSLYIYMFNFGSISCILTIFQVLTQTMCYNLSRCRFKYSQYRLLLDGFLVCIQNLYGESSYFQDNRNVILSFVMFQFQFVSII